MEKKENKCQKLKKSKDNITKEKNMAKMVQNDRLKINKQKNITERPDRLQGLGNGTGKPTGIAPVTRTRTRRTIYPKTHGLPVKTSLKTLKLDKY